VGRKLFDVDSAILENHPHDKAVAVALDVEDRQRAGHIGAGVGQADVLEALPFRRARRIESVLDRCFSIGMLCSFAKQVALANHVQNLVITNLLAAGKQNVREFGILELPSINPGDLRHLVTINQQQAKKGAFAACVETDLSIPFSGRVLSVNDPSLSGWAFWRGSGTLRGDHSVCPMAQIAATTLEHDLTVVTRNVKDFAGLGVTIFNPWDVV